MCLWIGEKAWAQVKEQAIAKAVIEAYVAQEPQRSLVTERSGEFCFLEIDDANDWFPPSAGASTAQAAERKLAAGILTKHPNILAGRTGLEAFTPGSTPAERARDLVNV